MWVTERLLHAARVPVSGGAPPGAAHDDDDDDDDDDDESESASQIPESDEESAYESGLESAGSAKIKGAPTPHAQAIARAKAAAAARAKMRARAREKGGTAVTTIQATLNRMLLSNAVAIGERLAYSYMRHSFEAPLTVGFAAPVVIAWKGTEFSSVLHWILATKRTLRVR